MKESKANQGLASNRPGKSPKANAAKLLAEFNLCEPTSQERLASRLEARGWQRIADGQLESMNREHWRLWLDAEERVWAVEDEEARAIGLPESVSVYRRLFWSSSDSHFEEGYPRWLEMIEAALSQTQPGAA